MTRKVEFQHNDIYVALTRTSTPGLLHWLICVVDDTESGWKLHATSKNSDVFRFEKVRWHYSDDDTVVVFIKVGRIEEGLDINSLVEYVKDIEIGVVPESQRNSEPQFNCRVWVEEAIRRLNDARVFVKCPDTRALAEEVNNEADAAERQDQKYLPAVATSQVARPW